MNTIREASDSVELEHAAEILQHAFAGHENARMGRGYARALLRTFKSEASRILLIASADGQVAGFAAGEPSSSCEGRYRSLRPAAALALMRRPWLLVSPSMLRMAAKRLKTRTEDAAPDEWFLALIGVHPRAQRRGVGRALLAAFEREGIRRGFTRATLLVQASNDRARSMYENCEWTTDGIGQVRVTYRKVLSPDAFPSPRVNGERGEGQGVRGRASNSCVGHRIQKLQAPSAPLPARDDLASPQRLRGCRAPPSPRLRGDTAMAL